MRITQVSSGLIDDPGIDLGAGRLPLRRVDAERQVESEREAAARGGASRR